MIDSNSSKLSIAKQCDLLSVNKSTYYYKQRGLTSRDLEIMKTIDEIYTEHPYFGARRMSKHLEPHGIVIGRKAVSRYYTIMAIEAVYPKMNLSKRNQAHKIYPYLLKGVEEAIENYGCPEIFNTDQGAQFTSNNFISILTDRKIKVSMDGKGRALDNVFIERFWCSLKQEKIYMIILNTVKEAKNAITDYITFYNKKRMHQSLEYFTPEQVHFRTNHCVKL